MITQITGRLEPRSAIPARFPFSRVGNPVLTKKQDKPGLPALPLQDGGGSLKKITPNLPRPDYTKTVRLEPWPATPARLPFSGGGNPVLTKNQDKPGLSALPPKDGREGLKKITPNLPQPDYTKTVELQFMWLDSLFQEVQKALGSASRSDMTRIQEAQRELLKKNLENLDKALDRMARERAARKRAAVCGLLTKIAAVVVIAVAVVAVAATATFTLGTGAFFAVAALSFAGAAIDMAGAGCAATQGRGFTFASLLKRAGMRKGSEALAAGITMDAGGLTSAALKESGLKPEAIMAISIAVTVVQAVVMNRCAARMMAPDKMSRFMKSTTGTLKDYATVIGGYTQSLCGSHTLEAAKNHGDGAVARSDMAQCDADRTQLDQSITRNLEFMRDLQKASEQSFTTLKQILDEWVGTLAVLTGPTGRTASMA